MKRSLKKNKRQEKKEMKFLRRELFIWGWTWIFSVVSPVLATGATFIAYVFVNNKNILTASDTFTTLMLFGALRFPISNIGRRIGRLGQSLQASKRITVFLSRETLPETHNSPSTSLGTSLRVTGHVGYASQLPFILNATFRDNILFGRPYDPVRYDNVIEACCLRADINLLSAGDIAEIGERGVTLSGGQKQRLSITRTVYTKHDASRQNRRNI